MGKKTLLKLEKRKKRITKWDNVLKKHNISNIKTKIKKKKSLEEIKSLMDLPDYLNGWEIRDKKDWKAISYNIEKQKISYLTHLYVKYKVPNFLLDILVSYSNYNFKEQTPLLVEWFLTIAQGDSFRKVSKEYFSKKEAHLYLQAPLNNPFHNFWWAKFKCAGVPDNFINLIIDRMLKNSTLIRCIEFDLFYKYLALFFKKHHKNIDRDTFIQIMDYIRTMRSEGTFSMKGRTLSSIIKLSNAWHRTQFRIAKGRYVSWEGIDIKNWSCKYHNKNWKVTQLKDSSALFKEGQKQRHCIGSYAKSCAAGSTSIFTVDSCAVLNGHSTDFYNKNITIEVININRTVTQVKGRLNRHPKPEEMAILKFWAGKNGLIVGKYL